VRGPAQAGCGHLGRAVNKKQKPLEETGSEPKMLPLSSTAEGVSPILKEAKTSSSDGGPLSTGQSVDSSVLEEGLT